MRVSILMLLIILNCSCKQSQKIINEEYNLVSMQKVINNVDFYDGKKIEIKGYFNFRMSESSVYVDKKMNSKKKIWVEFDFFNDIKNNEGKFFFKEDNVLNYTGKKVTIRGVYNKKYNGHLAAYNGSINVHTFKSGEELYK